MNEDWIKLELESLTDEDMKKLKAQVTGTLKSQCLYVMNDNSISACGTYDIKPRIVTPHDCPRCGAPLRESTRKCEYCLSEFW